MDKAGLRDEAIARVKALSPARRALEEELLTAAIQDDPAWRRAGTILLYRSLGWEWSTVGLANGAWRAGKRTLFPRIAGDGLELVEAASWQAFRPGARGMWEPSGHPVDPAAVDLAIVPGVAWDATGGRLGRGAGYYDRFLPRLACPTWGVGFDAQVVEALPREAHDHAVTEVWSCRLRNLFG